MRVFRESQHIYIFIAMFVFSGAFTYQLILGPSYSGLDKSAESRVLNNILPLIFYIYYISLIINNHYVTRKLLIYFWSLISFVFLGFISSIWSYDLSGSLIDGLTLLFLTIGAFGVIAGVPVRTFVNAASVSFLIMMLASLIYIYFIPSYGLMSLTAATQNSTIAGTPQGVFLHKNNLGYMAGLIFIFAFGLPSMLSKRRRFCLMASSFVCLVLSDSATNWAAVGMAISVYGLWLGCVKLFKNRAFSVGFISVYFVCFSIIIYYLFGDIISFLGRDVTLTGRIYIWSHALDLIYQRPWTGYGMASIWETGFGYIAENPHFASPHAHNTWLEILLMTGFPGLALALAMFLSMGNTCFLRYDERDDLSSIAIILYFYMIFVSMSEFSMFRGNAFPFLLMIIIFGYLHLSKVRRASPFVSAGREFSVEVYGAQRG